jgi:hypothetical protein
MFVVFKQLENGEFERVASRDKIAEAVQLLQNLNRYWPGEYEVRDSETGAVRYILSAGQEGKSEFAAQ